MTGYTFKPSGYPRDYWIAEIIDAKTRAKKRMHERLSREQIERLSKEKKEADLSGQPCGFSLAESARRKAEWLRTCDQWARARAEQKRRREQKRREAQRQKLSHKTDI